MTTQTADEQAIRPSRFELRIGLIFLGLFIPIGIHVPYLPLWLEANGFGAEQIAIILSAPMFLRVVTTPVITALADRWGDRAHILMLAAGATLLFSLGYFLEPGYGWVLGISLVLAVAWTPQVPLLDAIALSGVRQLGATYTRMRVWGSGSYLAANLAGGVLLSAFGVEAVPAIMTGGLLVAFLLTLIAPRLGSPWDRRPDAKRFRNRGALRSRHFLLLVFGAGIINASHGFMFGFASIYWKSVGIGDSLIGALWAFAVVAEVAIFAAFPRFFDGASTRRILVLAGALAIVRWTIYPHIFPIGAGLPGFFFAQSLHAFSTGLVLIGVQKVIAESMTDQQTGAAQGIAYFANGFSIAAVTLGSGWLYDRFGVGGFYAMAVVALAGLLLTLMAGQPQSSASGGETREPA